MSVKGLMPIISLSISSSNDETNALVFCESAYSHSCLSSDLARRVNLSGVKIELTVNGLISVGFIDSEQVIGHI